MSAKRTIFTAASAYVQMAANIVSSLLLVRIATRSLDPEEFGLWSFTFSTIGYFILFDFGISFSLGRLLADAATKRDEAALSGWIYLVTMVLTVQSLIVTGLGLGLRDSLIVWFGIPVRLVPDARELWNWCLVIQAITLPLRVLPGVIHAQNRVYWANLWAVITSFINLFFFWYFLHRGYGVMAYAYAMAIANFGVVAGHVGAVFFGRHRIRLLWVRLPWEKLRELFGYSLAVFVATIAAQISGASQLMILTKMAGLDVSAMYNVTARMPALFMALTARPFDACRPRWITGFCAGNDFRSEFLIVYRLTLLMAAVASVVVCLANPLFVLWWTEPRYFGGIALNNLLVAAALVVTMIPCLNIIFQIHKRMNGYMMATLFTALGEIALAIYFASIWGEIGLPIATLIVNGGFLFWYLMKSASRMGEVPIARELLRDVAFWLPVLLAAMAASHFLPFSSRVWDLASLIERGVCVAVLIVPILWRCHRIVWENFGSRLSMLPLFARLKTRFSA